MLQKERHVITPQGSSQQMYNLEPTLIKSSKDWTSQCPSHIEHINRIIVVHHTPLKRHTVLPCSRLQAGFCSTVNRFCTQMPHLPLLQSFPSNMDLYNWTETSIVDRHSDLFTPLRELHSSTNILLTKSCNWMMVS